MDLLGYTWLKSFTKFSSLTALICRINAAKTMNKIIAGVLKKTSKVHLHNYILKRTDPLELLASELAQTSANYSNRR